VVGKGKPNRLYYGDCLTILREMGKHTADLIYLDPPFKSNREYNAIYTDETGRPLPDQVEAFNDTWTLDEARERAIRHMPILLREAGVDDVVADFLEGVDKRTPGDEQAATGLPVIHGGTARLYAGDPQAHRLDLSALRSRGQPLHQGYDGRHFRTHQLPQRNYMATPRKPQYGQRLR
jgi:L-fucose mutarotase/ribose pyranase (RbsD/FucU family)